MSKTLAGRLAPLLAAASTFVVPAVGEEPLEPHEKIVLRMSELQSTPRIQLYTLLSDSSYVTREAATNELVRRAGKGMEEGHGKLAWCTELQNQADNPVDIEQRHRLIHVLQKTHEAKAAVFSHGMKLPNMGDNVLMKDCVSALQKRYPHIEWKTVLEENPEIIPPTNQETLWDFAEKNAERITLRATDREVIFSPFPETEHLAHRHALRTRLSQYSRRQQELSGTSGFTIHMEPDPNFFIMESTFHGAEADIAGERVSLGQDCACDEEIPGAQAPSLPMIDKAHMLSMPYAASAEDIQSISIDISTLLAPLFHASITHPEGTSVHHLGNCTATVNGYSNNDGSFSVQCDVSWESHYHDAMFQYPQWHMQGFSNTETGERLLHPQRTYLSKRPCRNTDDHSSLTVSMSFPRKPDRVHIQMPDPSLAREYRMPFSYTDIHE